MPSTVTLILIARADAAITEQLKQLKQLKEDLALARELAKQEQQVLEKQKLSRAETWANKYDREKGMFTFTASSRPRAMQKQPLLGEEEDEADSENVASSSTSAQNTLATPTPQRRRLGCNSKSSATSRQSSTTSVAERIEMYPNEQLYPSPTVAGRILCVCHVNLVNDKLTMDRHFACAEHLKAKERFEAQQGRMKRVSADLLRLGVNAATVQQEGKLLQILRVLLRTATFSSFQELKSIIGIACSRRTMADRIPDLLSLEWNYIRQQMTSQFFSMTFDACTKVGKIQLYIARFIDDEGILRDLLCFLENGLSWTGSQIKDSMLRAITFLELPLSHLVGTMHDRAGENVEYYSELQRCVPHLVDMPCIPHTLNHVGEHMHATNVDAFCSLFRAAANYEDFRMRWLQFFGRSIEPYSSTRWWSYLDFTKSISRQMFGMTTFLRSLQQTGKNKETVQKLLGFLANERDVEALRVEMAIYLDFGSPFAHATEVLESNGLTLLRLTDQLEVLQLHVKSPSFATLESMTLEFMTPLEIVSMKQAICSPAIEYYNARFGETGCVYSGMIAMSRAARLLDPFFVSKQQHDDVKFSLFSNLPFQTPDLLKRLQAERLSYLQRCNAYPCKDQEDATILQWWHARRFDLPALHLLMRKTFSLQTSSAAAERAFSMLRKMFNDSQENALMDYVTLSLILRYNYTANNFEQSLEKLLAVVN